MSSVIDSSTLTLWNRKLHYYVGLYFLLFIWLFSFTGLLLNHHWNFAEFFPNRKTSSFERSIEPPPPTSEVDQARDLLTQLGLRGEVGAITHPTLTQLNYTATRPGFIYQIQADLTQRTAKVAVIEYNVWGILHDLHTFSGANVADPTLRRDWILTTIWAVSMDALAVGLIFMVCSSYYMWWVLPQKRIFGLAALSLGTIVCGLFVFGLRWLYR